MSKYGTKRKRVWLLWTVVLCGGLLLPAIATIGQETAAPPATTEADATAPEAVESAEATAPESAPAKPQAADAESTGDDVEPGGSVTGQDIDLKEETPEDAAAAGIGALWIGLTVAALFILPMMVGGFLARALKMPDHGWKISLVLGALSAS